MAESIKTLFWKSALSFVKIREIDFDNINTKS